MNDILFDLDGTISDSRVGIVRSTNYALNELGLQEYPEKELIKFIGPPLDYMFNALIPGCTKESLAEVVAKYRERYFDVGWRENVLYEGIEDALNFLAEKGLVLSVCTSKRTDVAEEIIEYFGLTKYLQGVYGADIGKSKSTLISEMILSQKCTTESWLIGDRSFDITAAKSNGLRTIGVLWGYGSEQEMSECSPDMVIRTPNELRQIEFKMLSVIGREAKSIDLQ
jgi:phosphoglycolate phosphatase